MRRMRELGLGHYVAIVIPVVGATFGVYYLIRNYHPKQPAHETTTASHADAAKKDGRAPASDTASGHKKTSEKASHEHAHESAAPAHETAHATSHANASGVCEPIEYRGAGPSQTRVTKAEWAKVMEQFHGAKTDLLGWLEKNRKHMPEAAAAQMERQVRELKVQRPPAVDEPDLAWRGIGIYTQGGEHDPLVKLGGGFMSLVRKSPRRARFEMVRLVAHAWAPCELARVASVEGAWNPLLKCLGVDDGHSCGSGTFSEAGWAVSTSFASQLAAPGCLPLAFKDPATAQCLSQIELTTASRNVASTPAEESHK
jgi:hypothetical protein